MCEESGVRVLLAFVFVCGATGSLVLSFLAKLIVRWSAR